MTKPSYNKTEAANRILRSLEGHSHLSDAPDTLAGDVLSEDEALSDIAKLMDGILPGQAGVLPFGISSLPAKVSDSKSFYVIPDHVNASDLNSGENPAYPLATAARAWALMRAYHGDVTYVTSSDSWQYGAGTEDGVIECLIIPADKPGCAMIGVSRGSEGVYWQPTGSAGWCIVVRALDTIIDGFCFWSQAGTCNGIYCDWASPTTLGENTVISNNTFTDDCDTDIQMEYTWYVDVFNNRFQQCNNYGIVVSASGSGVSYLRVYDNWFNDCGAAMILGNCDNSLIRSNHVYNQTAQATGTCTDMGIVINALGSYNQVEDNYFSCILAKWNQFCSASPTDAWIFNHLLDGNNTANPT